MRSVELQARTRLNGETIHLSRRLLDCADLDRLAVRVRAVEGRGLGISRQRSFVAMSNSSGRG